MSLFAIADTHLSLGTDKPMDIFNGWDNYIERLKTNWLNIIKNDDTVVIAGDVSWAMSLEGLDSDFAFINSLPGKKLIIKGNHDYWWETMAKMNRYLESHGFNTIKFIHNSAEPVGNVCVCGSRGWFDDGGEDKKILLREVGRLEASISAAEKTGLEPVVFLHYPPVCQGFCCGEIAEVLKKHEIRRCYYGHLHGKSSRSAIEGNIDGTVFRLISCDHTGFSPVIVEK